MLRQRAQACGPRRLRRPVPATAAAAPVVAAAVAAVAAAVGGEGERMAVLKGARRQPVEPRHLGRKKKKGGAFNPNLVAYDPNSAEYVHGTAALPAKAPTASASFNPCPPDRAFEGHRASHDCRSYAYCRDGRVQGSYSSCNGGLMFDNRRGACDWAERVHCEHADESHGDLGEGGGRAAGLAAGVGGAAGWSGGSDWGGSWINGAWVSDSDAGPSSSSKTGLERFAAWSPANVVPYPPPPAPPSRTDGPVPGPPGNPWSALTRGGTAVAGRYTSGRRYDDDRAKPANLDLRKVDRVNFASFQADFEGNVWGSDPWADPLTLFGPHDWSIAVREDAGFAPQFADDNGFDDAGDGAGRYVGASYVDPGAGVYCHRAAPTGPRECHGHRAEEGLIGRAHAQGAAVYPSVGGPSAVEVFPELSKSARARRNFAKNCVGLIREYNFDGIDMDWEFPGSSDKINFVVLLEEIRAALDAYAAAAYPNGDRTFGLTAALPCGPRIIGLQDVPRVSTVLTELNLLSFDFHGTWDARVGVNAPLVDQPTENFSPERSVDGCVRRWIREGADPAKINVALPFYGRSYGVATGLYADFDGPDGTHWQTDEGQPRYADILARLPEMVSVRDDATRTQYAYFQDGGVVSFDDSQAICDKVEYVREGGLNGVLIWELSGDMTEELATPLLDVVNYKLQQGDDVNCELFRMETRDQNGEVLGRGGKEPNPWYVNWEVGSCVNDGRQAAWMGEDDLFRRKEECCGYKFEYKFDECVGPPTLKPSPGPTKEPTTSPISTEAPIEIPKDGISNVSDTSLVSPNLAWRKISDDTPQPPETWCLGGCKGAGEQCVGNQNHPQNIKDDDCKPCQSGQTYWPCDVDGLCFCWNPSTPRIPPAPGSGLAQLSDELPCTYFTEGTFNLLAPEAKYPYTYQGLCKAIDSYNAGHAEKIFMMGSEKERKSELASFLGHTLHESDEWKAAREYLICADSQVVDGSTYCKPCDSGGFNWETFKCDGVGLAGDGLTFNGYCNNVIQPPAACPCDDTLSSEPAPLTGYLPASKIFFGRGAIQLSWNYNYRAASEALTGDAMTFCNDPDLVATTPEYAWGAGVFFWMENLKEETTCHIEALRNHDFGGTLNNINGGLECPAYHGGWHGEAIKLRLNRYCKASWALGLDSILVFDGCKLLNNSYAECLGDGTCPDCQPYSDSVQTISIDSSTEMALPVPAATTVTNPVNTPGPTSKPTTKPTSKPTPLPEQIVSLSTPGPTPRPTSKPTPVPVDANACSGDLMEVDGLPGCCVPEPGYWGDGACDPDPPYNTAECSFDGGDCCQATCDPSAVYGCSSNEENLGFGPFGYFCVNPYLDEYIDPELCLVSDRTRIGDGRCDAEIEIYNTQACNWDGGDCCKETCDQSFAHFECGDTMHPYDCQNPAWTPITPSPTKIPTKRPTRSPTNDPTQQPVKATLPAVEIIYVESEASLTDEPTRRPTPNPTPKLTSVIAKPTRRPTRYPTSKPTTPKPTPKPTPQPITGVYILTPSDDATIVSSYPNQNYGNEEELQVDDDSGVIDALIRFDLSNIDTRKVASALLRLYCTNKSNSGGIIGETVSFNWNENLVTWASAPVALGTPIHSIGSVEVATWYEIDVISLFSGGNKNAVSIRMTSNSWDRAGYSSKEGPEPPQLVLHMESGESQMNLNMAESKPASTIFCASDVHVCPDGTFVSREADDGCKFASCQDQVNLDNGRFFPVWETGGAICTDGTTPHWASGAYLKQSKSECCEAFFMLQMDECLKA